MPHCCGRALVDDAMPRETAGRRMVTDHADCGYANQLQSERSSPVDRRGTISRRADSTGDGVVMSKAAYVAVDWGTSSFRLWLVDRAGDVLGERRSHEGMMAAGKLGFRPCCNRIWKPSTLRPGCPLSSAAWPAPGRGGLKPDMS